MTPADDIDALRTDSVTALNASYNYFTHTKSAWRLVQQLATKGHKVTIRSQATGTTVDQNELPGLAQEYVTGYLATSTFGHFVSLLEDFVFDFLRLWLIRYPGSLSGKQVDFKTVLESADKSEIVRAVVEKELGGLRYDRVATWFRHLERLASLGCPSQEQVERLAEIKATRDVLVHNKGIANLLYIEKSMGRARFAEGDKVDVPEGYHRESWQLIRQVVTDIAGAAIQKLRK